MNASIALARVSKAPGFAQMRAAVVALDDALFPSEEVLTALLQFAPTKAEQALLARHVKERSGLELSGSGGPGRVRCRIVVVVIVVVVVVLILLLRRRCRGASLSSSKRCWRRARTSPRASASWWRCPLSYRYRSEEEEEEEEEEEGVLTVRRTWWRRGFRAMCFRRSFRGVCSRCATAGR